VPLCVLLLVLCELPQAAHTTAPLTNTAHTPRAFKALVSLVRPRERPRVDATARPKAKPIRADFHRSRASPVGVAPAAPAATIQEFEPAGCATRLPLRSSDRSHDDT
jgi:hypothetical protein